MNREQETAMFDQPDAMDQGEHIAIDVTPFGNIECDCGAIVAPAHWQAHIEGEGA